MGKKYVVVACGSGIATSKMVSGFIEELCEEHGIEIYIYTCTISELYAVASDADIIVTTSRYSRELDKPVIDGTPFLTGVGKEEVVSKLLDVLKKE